jgi:hypothetical protein
MSRPGKIPSQAVFNTAAQRGINSVSVTGNKLLVTNCSVGASDYNTGYFTIAGLNRWKQLS